MDEQRQTRGGRRAAAEPSTPPSTPPEPPVSVDEGARDKITAGLEDDEAARTKVSRDWVLSSGPSLLGIPLHELAGALDGDEREELTIGAVRKAVAEWKAKVQNPGAEPDATDEEE